MRKSAGFTLIELVIVIIILGILGAVAAPRLFNLQGDAYGANLNALKSSISTAATMANAKAQIQGVMDAGGKNNNKVTAENKDGSIKGYEYIKFVSGYPAANAVTEASVDKNEAGILATLDGFEAERYDLDITTKPDALIITPKSVSSTAYSAAEGAINDDACAVIYTQAKNNESTSNKLVPAKVEAFTGGC